MTGLETLALEAAAKSLAGIVAKTGWDKGGQLLTWLGGGLDEKRKQIIFQASQQYVKNYNKRHGILKVLGMREPVSLESVYTTVQLLSEGDICKFETIAALEETYRNSQSRRFHAGDSDKQPGITVANNRQYLMVLGEPGAGKSTFLRKMGLEALKGKKKEEYQHSCIPVFIELKKFTDKKIYIEKIIAEEFEVCNLPNAEKYTETALKEGKLLILLDGLDEVPTKNLNSVIDQIQDFVDKYDKNRFITSCRTAAYRSSFRRFSDVVMADFDDTQIEQFIRNWFNSEEDKKAKTAEKCWELLQKSENKGAKELAQTPLLLTFLCLVYDQKC